MEHVSRWGVGRTLPYLAHTIKQSVEFYYFNSKNRKSKSLILICFIILIGKFYFNSKIRWKASWTVSFWAGSLKKTVKASDEQFTFAIPIIFSQSIYVRDVSLKNCLILYVKQKKSMSESWSVSRFEGLGNTVLPRLPLSSPNEHVICSYYSYSSSKHVLLALWFRWP